MSLRSGNPAASPRRSVRLVATAAVVGLASTAIVAAGGGTAAAADLPNAQSVGRLVDGALGGNPIQSIADVQDARATAPGETSVQNPLTVNLLNALKLPLDNVIKIPTNPAVDAGVVNQIANANLNGASRGAAGAVADDGGASLGDDGDGAPAFATIALNASALGSLPIPALPNVPGLPTDLPGGGSLAALGGVTATLGAVYSTVGTAKGGKVITPSSGIASVNLSIGSPALGALLSQLKGLLDPAVLRNALSAIPGLSTILALLPGGSDLTKCALTAPSVADISLAGGGVVLDVDDATITVNLQKLVKQLLDVDISKLSTSNFDLISFLVKNLPKILSTGLSGLVTSITDPLKTQFSNCTALLGPLGDVADTVIGLITAGQKTLTDAIGGLSSQFTSAASGPLGQLADGLKNIVDIGLNVQSGPGIQPRDTDYPFESNLEATPNQNTPVVKNQTLVRAIEIQLLNAAAIPGGLGGIPTLPLPGLNSAKVVQLAGKAAAARPVALAPGDGAINLALANSAAGPSSADDTTTTPSSSVPPTVVPSTNIPTGIPAGQAAGSQDDGLPVLPLVAILMLMMVSGGAFWQYRMRGMHQH